MTPIVLSIVYFRISTLGGEFAYGIVNLLVSLVIFTLLFWAVPGIFAPAIFNWWPAARGASKQLFFSMRVSIILVFIAYLLKAGFSLLTYVVSSS